MPSELLRSGKVPANPRFNIISATSSIYVFSGRKPERSQLSDGYHDRPFYEKMELICS